MRLALLNEWEEFSAYTVFPEYKKDTFDNCMKVLEDCGDKELVLLFTNTGTHSDVFE